MAKKEITYRPMHGFSVGGRMNTKGLEINVPAPHEWSELGRENFRVQDQVKDAIIAELNARIAELEAKEEKRRTQQRDLMRKRRSDRPEA